MIITMIIIIDMVHPYGSPRIRRRTRCRGGPCPEPSRTSHARLSRRHLGVEGVGRVRVGVEGG